LCNLHFSILIFLDLILFVSGIEGTDNMPVKQAFALLLLRNFARSLSFTIVRSEGQGKYSGRGVEGMACLCRAFGTTVPSQWHNCAKRFAQPFQRFGTIVSVGGTTVLLACHKPYGYLNGKQRKERCW